MAFLGAVSQQGRKPLYYPSFVNIRRWKGNRHTFKPLISGSSEVPGSITMLIKLFLYFLGCMALQTVKSRQVCAQQIIRK